MYSGENTKWFSQTMLTYKDRRYGTEGYLRLSINTNTMDFTQFNAPTFNISITNNFQKTCFLTLSDVSDLLKSFDLLVKQQDANGSEIYKRYKDIEFYFKCFFEENLQERLIIVQLKSSETDFSKVIIPIQTFSAFKFLLDNFKNNYFSICKDLLFQSIQSETINIIKNLPGLIKGISYQVSPSNINIQQNDISPDNIQMTQNTINDLDKFLGENMENIKISELEENIITTPTITEVSSKFVKNILKNNLYNLENMLNSYMLSPCPIDLIKDDIIKNNVVDDGILHDLNEDDKKSIYYISKLFFNINYEKYIEENESITDAIPVFKYKVTQDIPDDIAQVVYDLFLFNIYIRAFRRRLEGRTTDVSISKSLFYLQLRCFTDVFVFSYLDKLVSDENTFSSIILNRYKYYDSVGVFEKYKILLSDYKCPDIKENDITSSCSEIFEKAINKTESISVLHKNLYETKWTRLMTKSPFSLEQILNELMPLELAEKMGKDLTDEMILLKLQEKYKISDEIIKFISKKERKEVIKKEEKLNNLFRVCKFFEKEIPSQYKDEFLTELKRYNETKFDLKTTTFIIDEFGENIVKALYLWNPDDVVIKNNYKEFHVIVENEIMTKELILTKVRSDIGLNETVVSDDWNFSL